MDEVRGQEPVEEVRPQGAAPAGRHSGREGPGEALVVAQKLISDPKVVAVIGPATSGGVASASQALTAAGLAHISPSATRTSLTKGANREATSSFFRVVAATTSRARPTRATWSTSSTPRRSSCSTSRSRTRSGLADAVEAYLKKKGVSVSACRPRSTRPTSRRSSTGSPRTRTSSSSRPSAVGRPDGRASSCSSRARRRRCSAATAPTDPAFKFAGLVRLELRAGHQRHRLEEGARSTAGRRTTREATLGSFGPPTYRAVEVALNAIKKACDAGKGRSNRRDVFRTSRR